MKCTLPISMLILSLFFIAGCGKKEDDATTTADAPAAHAANIDPLTHQKYGFFGRHPRPIEFLVVAFICLVACMPVTGVAAHVFGIGDLVVWEPIPLSGGPTPLWVAVVMVVLYYVFLSPSDPAVLSPITSGVDDLIRLIF